MRREFSPPFLALVRCELLSQLRGTRGIITACGTLAIIAIAVLNVWPEEGRMAMPGEAAEVSRYMLWFVSLLLSGAAVLVIPGLSATAIVIEREQETLEQLHMTLIPPLGILFAKTLTALGFFGLVIIALAPVISSVLFLIGIDWFQLLWMLAGTFALGAFCATAGLCASAWCRKSITAIFVAYGIVIAIMALIGFLMMGVTTPYSLRAIPFAWMLDDGGGVKVVIYGVLAIVFMFLARRWLVHEPPPPQHEGEKPIDDPALLRYRRRTWPFYLIDPLARKKPIEDGRNPMLVRELRWGAVSRGTFLIRTGLCAYVVWFVASWPALTDVFAGDLTYWFVVHMAGISIFAPVLIANTLTKEYESGNFDMLRMTLLTPGEIMIGKWSAAITIASPLLGAAIAGWIGFAFSHHCPWAFGFAGYLTDTLVTALSVSIGMAASVGTRRTTAALIMAVTATCAVFYGSFIGNTILGGSFTESITFLDSPIFVFAVHGPYTASWWLNLCLYSVVSAGLVMFSIWYFNHYRRQDV